MKAEQRNKYMMIALVVFLIGIFGFAIYLTQKPDPNASKSVSVSPSSTTSAKPTTTKSATASPKEGALEGKPLPNFEPVAKIDSLQKIDTVVGTGDEVKAGDTVTAHYTGAVAATGIVFQSSLDTGNPVPFGLNQVIKGWTDGVPGMKVGGKRRLLIPAAQAYGANPPSGSGIPANADLVFDIELVKIGR
ncbi:MAG: FKBP-type peptidyl-prolyl cis-trans isomerase [bacterium]